MSNLPSDAKERKTYPIASGVIDYFPDALAEVAKVSRIGNDQHNGIGTPLRWDRSKSTDESDALMRHFIDRGTVDSDGALHSAKLSWRALALLQKEIEGARQKIKKDYTGAIVGNRTVLAFSRFTKHKDPMWLVRCSCGFEFESLTQDLKRLECRNCRMIHKRKRPYESLYNTFVKKASKRHPVHITYPEFLEFTKVGVCHYCDEPIIWLKFQTRPRNRKSKGHAYNLDRKDSSLPYTVSNVVVCCGRCNAAKNNHFTYEEWVMLGGLIKSWRKNND